MVFFTCVLKISNHFIHFSLKNGELDVKKKTLFLEEPILCFFFRENNKWIKKFYEEEMCGFKCSILIYLFIKLEKLFFKPSF